MCLKLYPVLLIFFSNQIISLEALDEREYPSIVSTTPGPSWLSEKYKYKIEILELQNAKMQKSIEELLKLHENKPGATQNQQQELSGSQFSEIRNTIIAEIAKLETQVKNLLQKNSENQDSVFSKKLEEQIGKIFEKKLEVHCEKQFADIQNTIIAKIKKVETELESILRKDSDCNATQKTLLVPKVERTQRIRLPQDCQDVQASEIYFIQPKNAPEPFTVLCDMDVRGGGWIYVLNRFDGSQNFYLNWTDYKNGFGKPKGEFWLGLEHLYQLTAAADTELLIELTNFNGEVRHAHYKKFKIGSEADNYKLEVLEGYTGTAGDAFIYHLGRNFSTLDHQDPRWGDCSEKYFGSWWYGEGTGCFRVQLTGRYEHYSRYIPSSGIHWVPFEGYFHSLKKARMMVRHQEKHTSG